jgi:hypothetical protein
MAFLQFLGMLFFDFIIGKVVDSIGDCVLGAISVAPTAIPRLGQPFAGALR